MHSSHFEALVQQAQSNVKEISAQDVLQEINTGSPSFYLIDVREEHEWNSGHIPGALHLGKGVIERDIEKMIPDFNAPLVLYCAGGFRSILAAESLQKMGYQQVRSMAGGYRSWLAASK